MGDKLGELLSKAREDLGISLETAAEETKIRMDFLENFEKNSFDFNLPDVYKREFLKAYAEFLKLDIQEIMAFCPIKAFVPLTTSSKRREMVHQVAKKSRTVDHSNLEIVPDPELDTEQNFDQNESITNEQKKYIYIAAGISIFLLLFMFLLSRVKNRSNSNDNKSASASNIDDALIAKPMRKKVSLMSVDTVKVLIRTKDKKETIFSGTLTKGNEKIVEYESPIQIYYDNGSVLSLELSSGERLHLENGLGAVEIK
jgi:cytoskeletal protein RodZ